MTINPGTTRARRRAGVRPDRQRPRRAGGQPGADPGRRGAGARRAAPTCPRRPTRCRPTSGQVVASATRLLQAIPAAHLNKLISELATALQGQAGNLRTIINAGTTFSKEFVAYQQQFTELLANAPPALDAVTAVAPAAPPGPGQHGGAGAGAGRQKKSGLHTLLTRARMPSAQVDNLVTSQSANLGCVLHDAADILLQHRPADQPDQPVPGPGLQPVLLRRRRQDRRGRRRPRPTTNGSPPGPEPGLPAHPPDHPARPRRAGLVLRHRQPIPDTLPGAGCNTVFGNGRRAGHASPASPRPPAARGGADRPGGRRRARLGLRPSRSTRRLYRVPGQQRRPAARPRRPGGARSCSWPGAPARPAAARAAAPASQPDPASTRQHAERPPTPAVDGATCPPGPAWEDARSARTMTDRGDDHVEQRGEGRGRTAADDSGRASEPRPTRRRHRRRRR